MVLKSLYRLNETSLVTATDSVNGNNWTYTGCTSTDWIFGKAINFASGSNEINISSVITQNLSWSAFTINFWTKKTWAFGANQWYIYCNSATNQNLYLYHTSSTQLTYSYQHSSWGAQTNTAVTHGMVTDKWYMITLTGTGTTWKLYINWVNVSTATRASTVGAFTSNNYMRISLSTQALQGTMDELSFSDDVWSVAKIKNMYAYGRWFI